MKHARDNIRLVMCELLEMGQSIRNFEESQSIAPREVRDDASCESCANRLEQRVVQCLFDGFECLIIALPNADRHQCAAAELHYLANVGKVHIYQPGLCDQFRDPLDALTQDIICQLESQVKRQRPRGNLQQAVIGDGDQCIRVRLQPRQSFTGIILSPADFE
jgi:hypothetical protein